MDPKAELIKEYFSGLPKDRLKLETSEHGFGFLEEMLTGGMTLEYGERVLNKEVHKYKFSNVPEWRMDSLLVSHARKSCNVCLYFKDVANSLFAFNLDKDYRFDKVSSLPEMAAAVDLLRNTLTSVGCEPLVITSGKGFHFWCRLAGAVKNDQLYDFMLRAMAKTLYGLHKRGLDHNRISPRFYPDPGMRDKISLRLFGSDHASSKVFSRVSTASGLLDEDASWVAFEKHLRTSTIALEAFRIARKSINGQI